MTDSVQVPWGKGEKNHDKWSEKNLKLNVYKQLEYNYLQQRTFCIMGQQVNLYSKLKLISVGVAKASRKRR